MQHKLLGTVISRMVQTNNSASFSLFFKLCNYNILHKNKQIVFLKPLQLSFRFNLLFFFFFKLCREKRIKWKKLFYLFNVT